MSSSPSVRRTPKIETSVSRYDQLNGALISLIILIGFLVAVMFLIWFTSVFDFSKRTAVELTAYLEPYGNEKPEGFEDDVLEPGVEEFPEVETPQLMDALEAVTDAVSSIRANLEKRDGDAAEMGKGAGYGSREGGPGTGNANVVPEHKRWQIEYESKDIKVYARQLDFFQIVLGAVHLSANDIVLISNVSGTAQIKMSDRKAQNKTLRFGHIKRKMLRWDESYVKKAGVDITNRQLTQFYPTKTRVLLRNVEQAYLSKLGKTLEDVRRTVFKVEPVGAGFEYKVTDMLFFN